MRRPISGGRGVPDTDASLGPALALSVLALGAFLAVAFPFAAAVAAGAVGGAVAATKAPGLPAALRERAANRRRLRFCLPWTQTCVVV